MHDIFLGYSSLIQFLIDKEKYLIKIVPNTTPDKGKGSWCLEFESKAAWIEFVLRWSQNVP